MRTNEHADVFEPANMMGYKRPAPIHEIDHKSELSKRLKMELDFIGYPDPKRLYRALEMTQKEFARRYDVSIDSLKKWCRYASAPERMSRKILCKIARELTPEQIEQYFEQPRKSGVSARTQY